MSKVSAEQKPSTETDEASVMRYLQDNPTVLTDYPEVFSALEIPHQTGGATSLVERQLKLLREENQELTALVRTDEFQSNNSQRN